MAVYFSQKISATGTPTALAWSRHRTTRKDPANGSTLVAVAFEDGAVGVYTEEGDPIDPNSGVAVRGERGVVPTALAWHPELPILAVGYADGRLRYWSCRDRRATEDADVHYGRAITVAVWTPDGARLITGDAEGRVGVWAVDDRHRPTSVCRHDRFPAGAARVTHVVVPPREDAEASGASAEDSDVERTAEGLSTDGRKRRADADGSPSDDASASSSSPTYFYYAVAADGGGVVLRADDRGGSARLIDADAEFTAVLHRDGAGELATLGVDATLSIHRAGNDSDGDAPWTTSSSTKLPCDGPAAATWAAPGTLAVVNERDPSCAVRVFDLDSGENYTLLPPQAPRTGVAADPSGRRLTCLSRDAAADVLACGQRDGRVTLFRRVALESPKRRKTNRRVADDEDAGSDSDSDDDDAPPPESQWRLLACVDAGAARLESLAFGPRSRLLGALSADGARVCVRVRLQDKVREGISVAQVSAETVVVESVDGSRPPRTFRADRWQVTGADVSENHLLVWNSRVAEVHQATPNGFAKMSRFDAGRGGSSGALAVWRDAVFRAGRCSVEVCDLAGAVRDTVPLDESHGNVCKMDVNGEFLAVTTSGNYLRMWRLGGKSPKAHGPTAGVRVAAPGVPDDATIESVRVNSDGTRASVLFAAPGSSAALPHVAVYDLDADAFRSFDFSPAGRSPENHAWDAEAPALLAVQTSKAPDAPSPSLPRERERDAGAEGAEGAEGGSAGGDASRSGQISRGLDPTRDADAPGLVVYTLFAARDDIVLQESHPMPAGFESLLGVAVPSLYVCRKSAHEEGGGVCFSVTMRDFLGMERADAETRAALLDFNYNLAVGDSDAAFAAVKTIKNPDVWENMAHMCIKNKRLDVAEMCLGNMGHVRGARAVRDAAEEPELDARVAAVAVHLGLTDEAERLYRGCDRHDLLNRLYQASGRWKDAVALASKRDRIHLKTTHYNHAKHLESVGDLQGAIRAYERAGCASAEVPRLLHSRGLTEQLERYVASAADAKLTKWWARFCESVGDLERALDAYQAAGDHLSLVRVYCSQGAFDVAARLAEESGDPAAAFHLARTYEARDDAREAVKFFGVAGRYGHAARLARATGMDAELMHLALRSPPDAMAASARYFLDRGEPEKAVILFHKAGDLRRAVDLCFDRRLFEPLSTIVDAIAAGEDENADPELLARCASWFLENGRFDKATSLLVKGGRHDEALRLALEHDVKLTEEMAEAMTPPKGAEGITEEARREILLRVAKACKNQGSYHLACKKYTQAGDRVRAMRALLKSGDTEKIVFFAGVSRSKEIYVMSANYLQTLDWHADPEIMKNIIAFYTKAKATESLASFFDACAQMEIDEYRDYEKALGAMRESAKHLAKSKAPESPARLDALRARTELVERFVDVRKLLGVDPVAAFASARTLLRDALAAARESDEGGIVRAGDVYAMLIEHTFGNEGDASGAFQLLEEMREKGVAVGPYVDPDMVAAIRREVGAGPEPGAKSGGGGAGFLHVGGSDEDDFLEEELEEDFEDGGGGSD